MAWEVKLCNEEEPYGELRVLSAWDRATGGVAWPAVEFRGRPQKRLIRLTARRFSVRLRGG